MAKLTFKDFIGLSVEECERMLAGAIQVEDKLRVMLLDAEHNHRQCEFALNRARSKQEKSSD